MASTEKITKVKSIIAESQPVSSYTLASSPQKHSPESEKLPATTKSLANRVPDLHSLPGTSIGCRTALERCGAKNPAPNRTKFIDVRKKRGAIIFAPVQKAPAPHRTESMVRLAAPNQGSIWSVAHRACAIRCAVSCELRGGS
jgi:hypothetical protein